MLIFAIFSHNYKKMSKRFSEVTTPIITKFVHDDDTFSALLTFPSAFQYSNPFRNASAINKGMSPKHAYKNYWLPWERPLSERKTDSAIIKPFHITMVKIRPVVPEILCLIGGPRRHLPKNNKNIIALSSINDDDDETWL